MSRIVRALTGSIIKTNQAAIRSSRPFGLCKVSLFYLDSRNLGLPGDFRGGVRTFQSSSSALDAKPERSWNPDKRSRRPYKNVRSGSRTSDPSQLLDSAHVKNDAYNEELMHFREQIQAQAAALSSSDVLKQASLTMSTDKAMETYFSLRDINPFYPGDIGRMIQMLHTSARLLKRARQYQDNVDTNTATNRKAVLKDYLDKVYDDLLSGKVSSSRYGYLHLISCYGTLGFGKEGVDKWKALRQQFQGNKAKDITDPKVIGAVLHVMGELLEPIEEIEELYNEGKVVGESLNLEYALIKAYIFAGFSSEALELFTKVLIAYPDEKATLSMIHDRFVGNCSDLNIALEFFNQAVNNQTPYAVYVHPSSVYRLVERVWEDQKEKGAEDFNKILSIYQSYLRFLPPSIKDRLFNNTTKRVLDIFMILYPKGCDEAYDILRNIIKDYADSRGSISKYFLNNVLNHIQVWGDEEITLSVVNAYDSYNVPKSDINYRCILNSFAYLPELDQEMIEKYWRLLESCSHNSVFDIYSLVKVCNLPSRYELFESLWNESRLSEDSQNIYSLLRRVHSPSYEGLRNHMSSTGLLANLMTRVPEFRYDPDFVYEDRRQASDAAPIRVSNESHNTESLNESIKAESQTESQTESIKIDSPETGSETVSSETESSKTESPEIESAEISSPETETESPETPSSKTESSEIDSNSAKL